MLLRRGSGGPRIDPRVDPDDGRPEETDNILDRQLKEIDVAASVWRSVGVSVVEATQADANSARARERRIGRRGRAL
jgi:hypothetical protein